MTLNERIGFSFIVRKDWLHLAASLALEKADSELCSNRLEAAVGLRLSGVKSKKNTITIINRIWLTPSKWYIDFRNRGLVLFANANESEKVALHWAMSSLAFTFFYDCVTILGRLSNLQDQLKTAQVLRRVRERWGDKPKTEKSLSAVVASIIDWGLLERIGRSGSFRRCKPLPLDNNISLFLVEALAIASGGRSWPLRDMLTHPSLFPFTIDLPVNKITSSEVMDLQHSGSNEPVLLLKDKYIKQS